MSRNISINNKPHRGDMYLIASTTYGHISAREVPQGRHFTNRRSQPTVTADVHPVPQGRHSTNRRFQPAVTPDVQPHSPPVPQGRHSTNRRFQPAVTPDVQPHSPPVPQGRHSTNRRFQPAVTADVPATMAAAAAVAVATYPNNTIL